MSLYQVSVLKNYINLQEKEAVEKAYKKYVKYFLNPTIQENIRSSKEEEYQGIFLTELFANILGYTLKPKADFNLVAEYKNQTNARKADGAILHKDIAVGVIELKGTNTKDLESIRKQAFDYKANQKGCVYVITSNFEKLRFYINDATEFEEFNLFELTKERFKLFYLCLQKDNIINNVPLKIKEASIVKEEQITKEFYKDYSLFKRELYRDLVKNNVKRLKLESSLRAETKQPLEELSEEQKAELIQLDKNVKLTLFKKSQKLIDRFLFIFFAEDRGLLPANSTELILEKWKADIDFGDERPLYNLFKQYFTFLDQGRQGTKSRGEIYAYNGGLFKEDTLLDGLLIDNELLYKHTHKLAGYDFESQVDVNILGHIFENSLNEIESVNAEIEGGDFDKQTSKRKKDGVFYTPKYITKYIVENTVGKLCEEKKAALGIKEEEYFKGRKNRNKATITKLVDLLDTYRYWLLQLTICDPACGSGAFLNQALDFLIKEHTYIDELKTKVLGGGLQFSDIENTILENNIFGVDLNEESVEIAKLSLWLRTAQPRRKLNDLSSNIKCGNSLIDSKAVAGDKAFSWETQFPQVFEKGGFDVVIGNPPYVGIEGISEEHKKYYKSNYKVAESRFDLYTLFIEKGISIKNDRSSFSFIIPGKILNNKQFKKARKIICKNHNVEVVKIDDKVFSDAQVDSVIITNYSNNNKGSSKYKAFKITSEKITLLSESKIDKILIDEEHIFKLDVNEVIEKLLKKIENKTLKVKEIAKVRDGVINGLIKDKLVVSEKINDSCKKLYYGKNIKRYYLGETDVYIDYRPEVMKKEEIIRKKGKAPGLRMRIPEIFEREKILTRFVGKEIVATYDNKKLYYEHTLHSTHIFRKDIRHKYLLALYNSNLISFYYKKTNSQGGDIFPQVRISSVEKLPIKIANSESQKEIINNVESIMDLNVEINSLVNKFQTYLQQKFQLEKLTRKLQNWHELAFGDFIKELNKAIKTSNKQRFKDNLQEVPTLTKKDEFEWLDLFEENKQKAQALQTQLNQTDKEIDAMVYELYGLTEDEIQIVENS